MKNLLYLSFVFCGLIGCTGNSSNSNKDTLVATNKVVNKPDSKFSAFLKEFQILKLPLTINTLEINIDSGRKFKKSDNDFIKSKYPDETYAYGILPDTTDTYKVVWLAPAEIQVPVLTTFTKSGKKISEEYLGVGGCGSDCCFECKEFVTINKDMSIFSVDSVKSCECDSVGPKLNTTQRYIRYKTGKILETGKIKFSEILQKSLAAK